MRKYLLIILVLLFIPLVTATSTCFADELCTLYGVCKNNTFAESTAKISIYFPNTTILTNRSDMTIIDTGRFNFTFVSPSLIGNYLQTLECNISGFIGVGEDEFTIGENQMIANSISDFVNLGIVILFFLIHLALVFFGLRNRITVFTFIGGIFGVIAGLVGLGLLSSMLGVIGMTFLVAYTVISAGFMLFFIPNDND